MSSVRTEAWSFGAVSESDVTAGCKDGIHEIKVPAPAPCTGTRITGDEEQPESVSGGEGLWRFGVVPQCAAVERFERTGVVDVDHGIELVRQGRFEVMTHTFRARQVDHADGALQPPLSKSIDRLRAGPERQQKVPAAGGME